MPIKNKTFDCVEMKHDIQRKLVEEFEARRGEFDSYADFIRQTTEADPWIQAFWARAADRSTKGAT